MSPSESSSYIQHCYNTLTIIIGLLLLLLLLPPEGPPWHSSMCARMNDIFTFFPQSRQNSSTYNIKIMQWTQTIIIWQNEIALPILYPPLRTQHQDSDLIESASHKPCRFQLAVSTTLGSLWSCALLVRDPWIVACISAAQIHPHPLALGIWVAVHVGHNYWLFTKPCLLQYQSP